LSVRVAFTILFQDDLGVPRIDKMKKTPLLLIVSFVFTACAVTYDLPVMYKKNYVPGTHALLRFDGYYSQDLSDFKKPLYLYRDGSVWFAEVMIMQATSDEIIAKGDRAIQYSWGNYKVDGDTIYIERFNRQENTNNYRRITLKGIIKTDAILWIQREENRQNPVKVNYETTFHATTSKPDSSGNWTRTRPQYNK